MHQRRRIANESRRTCAIVLALLVTAPVHARADSQPSRPEQPRPRIGVAFGGGSARGLAHIGVVRWFEEHRIPIDVIAGTSMGGLVGGAIASGLSAGELTTILDQVNWDEMFGFSPFRYKNIRRKEDARAYPSRIELGLKHGVSLPIALNSGQQVDFLLARIAGRYGTVSSFDELPTPFRAMAVDLVTAEQVVLDKGSLVTALRATMSLPGIFPPVEREGSVLVDGGAMNNVPADVVRKMGADVVIAIHVGDMSQKDKTSGSLLGLMGETVDAMMRATTRVAMQSADIVINPRLDDFGSLDWRRSKELEAEGYRAAEAMKDRLLPLAVSDGEWAAYLERRRARTKTAWPVPQFVSVAGAAPADGARIEAVLAPLVRQDALDVQSLETALETFAGLDRYESIGWELEERAGAHGLLVQARPRSHAPPFLMLAVNLENTTSDDFAFQLSARYLTFDILGAGSELRVDGTVGARPGVGAELYRALGRTPVFMTATASFQQDTLAIVSSDVVVARYNENRSSARLGAGVNLGRESDVRLTLSVTDVTAHVKTGDPGLPELDGKETRARLAWRYNGQDSPVVPSRGVRVDATLDYFLEAPDPPARFVTDRSNDEVTQASIGGTTFWSLRQRDRLFLSGGAGTTWGHPLATEQFQLGAPLRLGAYSAGELRGDHFAVVSTGYLRAVGRLPDFLGGPLFLGSWVESGSAFNDLHTADLRTNVSVGAIAESLIGPVLLGASFDFQGASRYYIGIGRLF